MDSVHLVKLPQQSKVIPVDPLFRDDAIFEPADGHASVRDRPAGSRNAGVFSLMSARHYPAPDYRSAAVVCRVNRDIEMQVREGGSERIYSSGEFSYTLAIASRVVPQVPNTDEPGEGLQIASVPHNIDVLAYCLSTG